MGRARRTSTVRKKGADRLVQIRTEASRLFLEHGYDGTSMQQIADAVGLTKAGLYHFFQSKEELLAAIVNTGVARLEQDVIEPARNIADPVERLTRIIHAHVLNISRVNSEQGNPITALIEDLSGLGEETRRSAERRLKELFELIRDALEELEAAGRLTPQLDTTAAAFSIIGMVMWTNRWRRPGGRLTAEDAAENIVRIVLHGVVRS